ncbi:general secretion pathway protein GspK [Candidatus Pacearchaeota archaeon]|nr:general secretion pathway protein GspK [Candidatus Pacearchaeota archaeon]
MTNCSSHRRGSALIFVLIVVSSMTILALSLARRCRVESKLAHLSAYKTKTFHLALAGLEGCRALLTTEEKLEPAGAAFLCRSYPVTLDSELLANFKASLGEDAVLAYWIRDELGYLSVNAFDPKGLEEFPVINPEQIAGILDWTDPDNDTSSEGAEQDYYERLESPLLCKNAPIQSLRELLFIKGITMADYLGWLGNQHFTPSESGLGDTIAEGYVDIDNPGLVNLFSVQGDGRVNINTVSSIVLSTFPGIDENAAEVVLRYRVGADGREGTEDDIYIESSSQFAEIEGLDELQVELLGQYCCFESSAFRVFSYARLRNYRCLLMATVTMKDNKPEVLLLERLL